jgi:hypothetical protein
MSKIVVEHVPCRGPWQALILDRTDHVPLLDESGPPPLCQVEQVEPISIGIPLLPDLRLDIEIGAYVDSEGVIRLIMHSDNAVKTVRCFERSPSAVTRARVAEDRAHHAESVAKRLQDRSNALARIEGRRYLETWAERWDY